MMKARTKASQAALRGGMIHLALVLAALAGAGAIAPALSAERTGTAPATVRYCHGYGCSFRPLVRFSASDMQTLKGILASGAKSAAAERAAIGRAEQWFERIAGAQTGTASDGAKDVYEFFTPPSQIDCVDEAENATTFLKLAASRGWLRHHTVGRIERRGFLVDGRYPHHTATIRDRATGEVWVVDSWVRANAQPPDIKPLSVWKKEGGLSG